MAPSEIAQVSTMPYPYSQRCRTATAKVANVSCNPYLTIYLEYVIECKDSVSLLNGPPVGREPQRKLSSVLHNENKIRSEPLSYSASALIAVFGRQLDIDTHIVAEQAEGY